MFRWCTDRLRIWPINSVLSSERPCDVFIGTRWGESSRRNRTMHLYSTETDCVFQHRKYADVNMVSPIAHFTVEDVWSTISQQSLFRSIDSIALATLYKNASGECAAVESKLQKPCSSGRFGCWTCTVIKADRASEGLVNNGYPELKPLVHWRTTLIEVAANPSYRCKFRRNGQAGKGPLTLEARRTLLEELLKTEEEAVLPLIKPEEIDLIRSLWKKDATSPSYKEV